MKNGGKHKIDQGSKHPDKGAAARKAVQGNGPKPVPGPNWGYGSIPPSKTRTSGTKLV
jgi:hypothetical protein